MNATDLKIIQTKTGLHGLVPIMQGHTTANIWLGSDSKGRKMVLKTSSEPSPNEVDDNIYSYDQIKKLGFGWVVPTYTKKGLDDNTNYVVLPYLGSSLTELLKSGQVSSLEACQLLANTLAKLLSVEPDVGGDKIVAGLEVWLDKITYWRDQLVARGLIPPMEISTSQLACKMAQGMEKTSLSLLDFTPDNLFRDPDQQA